MAFPWELNQRLRPKAFTIGVNFAHLTPEIVQWIQRTYTTPDKEGNFPSQAEVALKASKKFKMTISPGLVQKACNVTEIE